VGGEQSRHKRQNISISAEVVQGAAAGRALGAVSLIGVGGNLLVQLRARLMTPTVVSV
jgi:hypothetical protein